MEEMIIPIEYQSIFNKISPTEKTQFNEYLSKYTIKNEHSYIKIALSIENSIIGAISPSPNWYYIFAKILFIAAKYDKLLEFWKDPSNKNNFYLYPFVARVYTYRNEFDLAFELCQESMLHINEMDRELYVIYFFETYFTMGLIHTYNRDFTKLSKVIEKLEQTYVLFKDENRINEENNLDLLYYPSILQVLNFFFNGKSKKMRGKLLEIKPWIDKLKDPWAKGYFFNLFGISCLQAQKVKEGEESFKIAYKHFQKVHDLRGFTTVGANLGVSLVTRGYRKEGREYIESILEPMISLKNYTLAITNMLTVAKSYLDEKLFKSARHYLEWAEKLSVNAEITEPATYSLFCYFYSRLSELDKADFYLEKLREMARIPKDMLVLPRLSKRSDDDVYTLLWYYNATAVNAMVKGNLQLAQRSIEEGIFKSDNHGHYDTSLELSTIAVEIILKRYLVQRNRDYMVNAIELLKDIGTLISKIENPYFSTIFNLLSAYLYLALSDNTEALVHYDMAKEYSNKLTTSEQYEEVILFKERREFLFRATPKQSIQNPLFEPFFKYWLSEETLPIFFTLEAMRLLNNLQFHNTDLEFDEDKDKLPLMLLILGVGGVTIFSKRFYESESIVLDESLVGGFFGALTSFSQELFGGGMLTRVDQENYVLLLEKISQDNILILIVEEETYHIRKKFKQFFQELSRMKVIEYLDANIFLTEVDPQFHIINSLIDIIFGLKEKV